MKSFRLDQESVADIARSWPLIIAALGVSVGLAYLGWFDAAWRVSLVVFAGLYFGYVVRGSFAQNLQERYPNARFIGLLSVGLVVATLGVFTRMVFPNTQGGRLDIVWLAISFVSILTFVVINRHDPDVLR
jgi:hypothetical protein